MYSVPGNDDRQMFDRLTRSSSPYGILIVDGDKDARAVLNIWLRQQGYNVWLAATGYDAIDLYLRKWHVIDTVLLDADMADMDGPRTLVALRRINPQVYCCCISSPTGHTDTDLFALGAKAVVRRPFRLIDIGSKLGRERNGAL